MGADVRKLVREGDEIALENAFFENECGSFFVVDWREDDASIVEYCAEALNLDNLTAEWRGENLVITYDGKAKTVPLVIDVADRHITICTLNDILSPDYEIRFIVCSHGSDSAGFAALRVADWQALEKECPTTVAENFIDPRKLPNIMTELIDDTLPKAARARYERMLQRNRRQ